MGIKESEDSSIDYEFIKKYIKDSSEESKGHFSDKKLEMKKSGDTEVFSRIGENESSENTRFNKKQDEKNEEFLPNEKVEFASKPLTKAKKEFLEHLEDESLSVDTCRQINHDWKRK